MEKENKFKEFLDFVTDTFERNGKIWKHKSTSGNFSDGQVVEYYLAAKEKEKKEKFIKQLEKVKIVKMKWFLGVVAFIVTFYVASYSGNVIERVREYDDLQSAYKKSVQQYMKLHSMDKTKMSINKQDSIIRLEYWWLGNRTAIKVEQERIIKRSQ